MSITNSPFALAPRPMRTLVFDDHEYWTYTMNDRYGKETDVFSMFNLLRDRGDLVDFYVFGDFSTEPMQGEREKVTVITSSIVDVQAGGEKNVADIKMINLIYQKLLMQPDIEQFILITGDNHFIDVVRFLRTMRKTVGIIGISGSLSQDLKNIASWSEEISPGLPDVLWKKLLQSIAHCERQGQIPSFSGTVLSSAQYFREDEAQLRGALRSLLDAGYGKQEKKKRPDGRDVMALVIDWDLVKKHGIYDLLDRV